MAEQKNTRLEKPQLDAIADMVDRGEADNESEAHRLLLNAGMREYGYQNGEHTDTLLKHATNRFGWLFGIAGIVGLAFTVTYPVEARLPAFAVILFSFGCFALERVLENYEPRVTKGILGLFGRGENA